MGRLVFEDALWQLAPGEEVEQALAFATGPQLAGLGNGVLLAVNNTVIMGSLPDDARGVASGMLETTRHFGHAFGVTIPTAILALAIAAAPASEALGVQHAFVGACLLMAGVAALGALLAIVPGRKRTGSWAT